MLAGVKNRRLKSSSIIETIVAVLILLLSFAAGIAIYNQVLLSTYSGIQLRANLEQGLVADSLTRAGGFEPQVLERRDLRFEVAYTASEKYPGLMMMHLQGYDRSGHKLSELKRLVRGADEN